MYAIRSYYATGALVLVDQEEALVLDLLTGVGDVDSLGDGVDRQIVDALPRADVDATLAEDA